MTIQVQSAAFRKALAAALPVIDRRVTIPILSSVRVVANGALQLSATDLDCQIDVTVPYDGEHAEFVLTSPDKVLNVTKRAAGDMVELDPAGGKVAELGATKCLTVRCGALTLDLLSTLPASDFPDLGHWSPIASATIGETFARALQRVAPAASNECTRYYLNGVLFHKVAGTDWEYRLVATDGHRMMVQTITLPDAAGEVSESIIPNRVVQMIARRDLSREPMRLELGRRMARNDDGQLVEAGGSDRGVIFSTADFRLTAKLIDGTYPDYKRVIPAESDQIARFKSGALLQALAALDLGKMDRIFRFSFEPGCAVLSLSSPEVGKVTVSVPCEHRIAPGFEIGFNRHHVSGMVTAAGGREVDLAFTDVMGPARFTNPEDPNWLGLVMPARLS